MHWLALPVCCVSEAGVMVRTYVERSMLVPDHVMTRLMMPRLEQLMGHSWLLDGMNQINLFIFYLFEMLFYMKTLYMVCALLLLHTAPPLQCLDLWGNMFFIMQRNGQRWELPPTPRIWLVTPGATPPQTPPHQNHVRGHQERLLYVQKHGLEGFICNASFIWVWGVSKLRNPLHIILHLWVITTLSPVQQVCTSSRMWLNLN